MKAYLNAKMILFRKILKERSSIISDKDIAQFKILKKISNQRGLKILSIHNEFLKV